MTLVEALVFGLFAVGAVMAYGGLMYMLWKLLGAFRWMEWSEARRANFVQAPGGQLVPAATKNEVEGAFVPSSESDAYIREEASRVAMDTGMGQDEAVNYIMDAIKKQNEKRANVANV